MIFTSESGVTDSTRLAEWDLWYRGHLAAMAAVPGIASAQRFRALDPGVPPSLAMYTVASAAVFDSEAYLRTRGMGPFVPIVDQQLHRRNLFDGLVSAPIIPTGGALLVADRSALEPAAAGVTWLRCVGIDRSIAASPSSPICRRLGRPRRNSATRPATGRSPNVFHHLGPADGTISERIRPTRG